MRCGDFTPSGRVGEWVNGLCVWRSGGVSGARGEASRRLARSALLTACLCRNARLREAAKAGRQDDVLALVKEGASLDEPDPYVSVLPRRRESRGGAPTAHTLRRAQWGETALMSASSEGHNGVVSILAANGADVDMANEVGGCPRPLPPWLPSDACRSQLGNTALILAAMKGHKNVVETLLRAGARRDLKDSVGAEGAHALTLARVRARARFRPHCFARRLA